MSITFKDTTADPLLVASGQSLNACKGVAVTDTAPLSSTETVTIALSQALSTNGAPGLNYDFYPATSTNLGTISDPNGGGTFDPATSTFTESGVIGGDPTFATNLLSRLVYKSPTLPSGQGLAEQAAITVTDGASVATDATPVIVGEVSAPAITGTVANEPIQTGGNILPFATATITSPYFGYNYYTIVPAVPYNSYVRGANYSYSPKDVATITITDGGSATDADGLLTGPGLSKTGVGTYSLANPNYYVATGRYSYSSTELQGLSFTTTAVPAGQTRTTSFELDVTDTTSGLTTKDTTTSVLTVGPSIPSVAPTIAGTQAGQTVESGNTINPFSTVTVADANANPAATATITVTDSTGKAGDTNGAFVPATGLTETAVGSGVYTLTASTTAALTTELDHLTFTPAALPSGQTSVATNFKLDVLDTGVHLAVSDNTTTVTETQPTAVTSFGPSPPTNNFLVHDETTGKVSQSPGETYTGPVAGITNDIILVTSDKININAEIPNVFIKTGTGDDALDVSKVNGNNVLDGSTGSNFMVGGSGNDTFFVDDRSAPGDIWSTVSGFHSGDDATVFGVTKADFNLSWVDGQGAAGFTGLTLHATASGKPTASLTLAGFTTADLTSGKLGVSFGNEPDGTAYMLVHGA